MFDFEFTYPWMLYVLEALPLLIFLYIKFNVNKIPKIKFSGFPFLLKSEKTFREKTFFIPFILKLIALSLLIFALAKPYKKINTQTTKIDSTAILFIVDNSALMSGEDLSPNRLDALKPELISFLEQHPETEVGLIISSIKPFLISPVTKDFNDLNYQLKNIQLDYQSNNSSMADAFAMAIERLKNVDAKNKIIIAISASLDQSQLYSFQEIIDLAQREQINIYNIVTAGFIPTTYNFPTGKVEKPVVVDEENLQQVSRNTGAEYYRATDLVRLRLNFADLSEQLVIGSGGLTKKVREGVFPFALLALLLLLLDLILSFTFYKSSV